MQNKPEQDRNQEATVYLGNLDERCEELTYQASRAANVFLPKDRISMQHQGFGFCEFLSEEDADYACKIMNQIKLFGKPIRVNKASYDKKQLDVGANLFIGNLDPSTDEQSLYDTFSTFGAIAEQPKIARDPATGESKGYGFVSFHDFEASDMAIENMNNQFLGGKQVSVQYAFKKDGKGERHGTTAERLLAAQAKKTSGGFFGSTTPAYIPPAAPAAAPAAPAVPAALPAGFSPAQVIGAPAGAPPPPPGMPAYQQQQYPAGYEAGYEQYYAQYGGANGYGGQQQYPQQGQQGYQQPQQQQQQQYGGQQGGGGGNGGGGGRGARGGQQPPPPPPMRMGF